MNELISLLYKIKGSKIKQPTIEIVDLREKNRTKSENIIKLKANNYQKTFEAENDVPQFSYMPRKHCFIPNSVSKKKFQFWFSDGNGGVIVINNSNNNNNDKIRKILSGEGVNVSNFNEGFALPFENLTKEEIGKISIISVFFFIYKNISLLFADHLLENAIIINNDNNNNNVF